MVIIDVHFSNLAGKTKTGKTMYLICAWFESQETGWEADPDQAPEIRTVVQVPSSSQFWVDGRSLEMQVIMADSVRASLGGSWFIP